jgi:magnesium-transporting ATPase (P-type)
MRNNMGNKMENKFLFNDRIIVRFISLFVIGAILFTVVWYLSYYFLPEGILQGKTGSAILYMLSFWGRTRFPFLWQSGWRQH